MSAWKPPEPTHRTEILVPVSKADLVALINAERERQGAEPLSVPPHARLEDDRGNPIEVVRLRWPLRGEGTG